MTVTIDGEDAATSDGFTEETCSITLNSKTPSSLSTEESVTESTRLRMYLPPIVSAARVEQEMREDDWAGDELVTINKG